MCISTDNPTESPSEKRQVTGICIHNYKILTIHQKPFHQQHASICSHPPESLHQYSRPRTSRSRHNRKRRRIFIGISTPLHSNNPTRRISLIKPPIKPTRNLTRRTRKCRRHRHRNHRPRIRVRRQQTHRNVRVRHRCWWPGILH